MDGGGAVGAGAGRGGGGVEIGCAQDEAGAEEELQEETG